MTDFDSFDVMNPAPRCPVALLLDVSSSMSGSRIAELNQGVAQFISETQADEVASMSVELEIITFSDTARVALPFTPIASVTPPAPFTASGMTAMGAALEIAERDIAARRSLYKSKGISAYDPWVVLMTDGEPNDNWQVPADRLRQAAERGSFMYIGLEIGPNVNHAKMCHILPAEPGPVKLAGLRFRQFFRWLTDSLRSVSVSAVSDQHNVKFSPIRSWADLP